MSDVLVVAEHRQGSLRDVSYEAVTAGRELAERTGGAVHVAVISGDVTGFADALNLAGVETVHTVAYGEEFNHDVYVQATTQLADEVDADVVVIPNTVNGLDYAPAVATVHGIPVVTDVTGFEKGDGLTVTREMYGSKVETVVQVGGDRGVVTIRPGEWPAAEDPGSAAVEAFDAVIDEDAIGSTVVGFEEVAGGDVDISEADVLVSIGRGIGDEDNLDIIFDLAEAIGATVSSSRPIVDAGWLPKDRQVGQSGKTVQPDVYLAFGISGAVQHIAGMKGAGTIIAVNTDPNAPIFDYADYGIVGDLFEVVPALVEEFV